MLKKKFLHSDKYSSNKKGSGDMYKYIYIDGPLIKRIAGLMIRKCKVLSRNPS